MPGTNYKPPLWGSPEEDGANGTPFPLPSMGHHGGGKPPIKAIPTFYEGYWFRSRSEARWAKGFDTLGIEWRYEYEGFILAPIGERYLPDFFLPEFGYWIEVKGTYPDAEALRKACLFNCALTSSDDPEKSRQRVYLVHGDIPWPYPKRGHIIGFRTNWKDGENPAKEDLCWKMCPVCDQLMIGKINTMSCKECIAELSNLLDDALESVPGIPVLDRMFDIVPDMVAAAVNTPFYRSGHKSLELQKAYTAARSARFERKRHRPSA